VPTARPWLYAHRGASRDAPENTIAAFRLALEQGADGIELDVHATADGVPVVIHDSTLDRTTDRSGNINELTLTAVKTADASAGWRDTGHRSVRWSVDEVRVPTFDEVLAWLPGDRSLAIDIKDVAAVAGIVRALRGRPRVPEVVLLMSFNGETIGESRRRAHSIPTGLLLEIGDSFEAGIASAVRGGHTAIVPFEGDLGLDPAPAAEAAAAAGLSLGCYVVNDRNRAAQLRNAGAAFVISDVPAVVGEERPAGATPNGPAHAL
jgi:glycerophosphoryl diester phosphodiesterase